MAAWFFVRSFGVRTTTQCRGQKVVRWSSLSNSVWGELQWWVYEHPGHYACQLATFYPTLFTVDPDIARTGWDWGTREHIRLKAEWPQACHTSLRTFCVCTDIPLFLPIRDYSGLASRYPYGWNWAADPSEDADWNTEGGLTAREIAFLIAQFLTRLLSLCMPLPFLP